MGETFSEIVILALLMVEFKGTVEPKAASLVTSASLEECVIWSRKSWEYADNNTDSRPPNSKVTET